MNYLNTDVTGYHKELLVDGFPSSSLKTRKFKPDSSNYRDRIIQCPKDYMSWYAGQKQTILATKDNSYYNQCKLSIDDVYQIELLLTLEMSNAKRFDYIQCNYPLQEQLNLLSCDVVFCKQHDDGNYYIDMCHLVFPNGWSANEAIGKPFSYFHEQVADSKGRNVVPSNSKFIDHFINSDSCFERVGAFSIKSSWELDRHPETGFKKDFVYGEPIYLRFERQVIVPMPHIKGFLFFIHSNIVDMRDDPVFFLEAIEKAHVDCYPRDVLKDKGEYFKTYLRSL